MAVELKEVNKYAVSLLFTNGRTRRLCLTIVKATSENEAFGMAFNAKLAEYSESNIVCDLDMRMVVKIRDDDPNSEQTPTPTPSKTERK